MKKNMAPVMAVLAMMLAVAGLASASVDYYLNDLGTAAQRDAWTIVGDGIFVNVGHPAWELDGDGLNQAFVLNAGAGTSTATIQVTAPTGLLYQYPRFGLRSGCDGASHATYVHFQVGLDGTTWDYDYGNEGGYYDVTVINSAGNINYASISNVWMKITLYRLAGSSEARAGKVRIEGDDWGGAVPEPSSILALLSGLAGVGGLAAWRKRSGSYIFPSIRNPLRPAHVFVPPSVP